MARIRQSLAKTLASTYQAFHGAAGFHAYVLEDSAVVIENILAGDRRYFRCDADDCSQAGNAVNPIY